MKKVTVYPRDETHVVVRPESAEVAYDLEREFSFEVPGRDFMPLYKAGLWDGVIKLYDPMRPVLYKGLLYHLSVFCRKRDLDLVVEDGVVGDDAAKWSGREDELREWADEVTSAVFESRDYQVEAFVKAVKRTRAVFISSTSSGKTMMVYRLCRFYVEETGKPSLVVTKRTNLVTQMIKDFEEYSPDEVACVAVKGGKGKEAEADYHVATWQSIAKMPSSWFDKFGCVCVDEAHTADAKSMTGIMEKCRGVKYRFGFTGTLKETKVSETVLVGLFGPKVTVTTTAERMSAGDVSGLKIQAVELDWPMAIRKSLVDVGYGKTGRKRDATYAEEMNVIVSSKERLRVVADYVKTLKGNTLVLFNRNEKFGVPLFEKIRESNPGKTYLVFGETDDEDREEARRVLEEGDDVVVVASLGVFSEGMSVNKIHHVVLAYPVKSRVRLLQSIGRGIRKHSEKEYCTFHDFADDMRTSKRTNYAWKHYANRIEVYETEGFDYSVSRIQIPDGS